MQILVNVPDFYYYNYILKAFGRDEPTTKIQCED